MAGIFDERSYALRRRLQVKLQTNNIAPELKPLVFTSRAADEPNRRFRQLKCFSMPVEYLALRGELKIVSRHRHGLDKEPAYLLEGVRIDACAKTARDKLCTKAQPKHWYAVFNGVTEKQFFGLSQGSSASSFTLIGPGPAIMKSSCWISGNFFSWKNLVEVNIAP